jgi:Domain of unknown function (DUF4385)
MKTPLLKEQQKLLLLSHFLLLGVEEFNYKLDFGSLDFRRHPELYRIGCREQGVLLVEPYKSEILPYWRFKTPAIA